MDENVLKNTLNSSNDKFSLETLVHLANTQDKIEIKNLFPKRTIWQKFTGNFFYDNEKFYIFPKIEICSDVKLIAVHWFYWSFLIDNEKN
ncbi:MAG: hypothetical protein J6C46_08990 [Clostridia bacterium]|nr:hypothetical protein [Clostridia bacterium]